MKKIIVSALVIFGFGSYTLVQHQNEPTAVVPIVPDVSPSPVSAAPSAPSESTAPSASPAPVGPPASGQFSDGTYTGPSVDAFYGNVQVQATIKNGRLADVKFLDYPNDRRQSLEISRYATPILTQEAISAQSGHVDVVSGATDTSQAFIESMTSALSQAKR